MDSGDTTQYFCSEDMGDDMDKVLITGGTGFIGSHVVRALCEKGIETGCLVRENSNKENIEGLPVKLEYGDIEDLESLIRVLRHYNFVIHIAALAGDWGPYERFYSANVEGTLNMLKACTVNGIWDVIITSSISVYGEENSNKIKDEGFPHRSHYHYFADRVFPCSLNYYRDTKAMTKENAIVYAKDKGLNLTILEPVWVYGEREFNTGFYEYLKTAASGIPFLPGSNKNKFHVIYAKDLARAYLLAYENKLQGINSFIIGNEKAELMHEIYRIFCEKAGIVKPKSIPKVLVYPFAFIIELLYTIFRSTKPPLITRGRVNMFYDNIEYSTQKAKQMLGFTNEYSIEEGIGNTVKWYKDRKMI